MMLEIEEERKEGRRWRGGRGRGNGGGGGGGGGKEHAVRKGLLSSAVSRWRQVRQAAQDVGHGICFAGGAGPAGCVARVPQVGVAGQVPGGCCVDRWLLVTGEAGGGSRAGNRVVTRAGWGGGVQGGENDCKGSLLYYTQNELVRGGGVKVGEKIYEKCERSEKEDGEQQQKKTQKK